VTRDGRELPAQERRLAVGWAGPDLAFYRDLTARENLRFFSHAAGAATTDGEIARRLEGVGLSDAVDRRAGELSSGMTQRLRLAFARLFDPPILLLDEPGATLDAQGRAALERFVDGARRTGLVVLASNDERDFDRPDQEIVLGGPSPESRAPSPDATGSRS
jgi:heme exporter protein A